MSHLPFTTPTSLFNKRGICSMNAALQTLLPTLDKDVVKFLNEPCLKMSATCQLIRELIQSTKDGKIMCITDSLHKYKCEGYKMNVNKYLLRKYCDPHEFLNDVLDNLFEEIKYFSAELQGQNIIQEKYGCVYDSRYFCDQCHKSNIEEPRLVEDRVLYLNKNENINAMLTQLLSNEVEGFNCENCPVRNGKAHTRGKFCTLPQFLTCVFIREKKHEPIDIEITETLRIPFVTSEENEFSIKYKLISIALYTGGHHLSVLNINGKWFKADDRSIKQISFEDIKKLEKLAYIRVYEKIN